jgi:hypothetical protein
MYKKTPNIVRLSTIHFEVPYYVAEYFPVPVMRFNISPHGLPSLIIKNPFAIWHKIISNIVLATIIVLISIPWTDEFLKWNTSSHGGLDLIRVPLSKVWKPDVILANSVNATIIVLLICVIKMQLWKIEMKDLYLKWIIRGFYIHKSL